MKKAHLATAFCLALALASCKRSQAPQQTESPLSQAQEEVADTTLWGHWGEDTGMSALQLITDEGDTLAIYRTSPYTGRDGRLLGDVRNYTDRLAVTLTEGGETLLTAINVTQLTQTWYTADGEMTLSPNGTAECRQLPYTGWKLWNGHILLASEQQQEYGTVTRVDTMDIVLLSDDSLAIRSHINQPLTFTHKP